MNKRPTRIGVVIVLLTITWNGSAAWFAYVALGFGAAPPVWVEPSTLQVIGAVVASVAALYWFRAWWWMGMPKW